MPLELAIAIVATATLTALVVGLLFAWGIADTQCRAYLDGYAEGKPTCWLRSGGCEPNSLSLSRSGTWRSRSLMTP